MLDLSPGAAVVLDGREWCVEGCEPQFGRVMLVDASDGRRMRANLGMLAHHPNCRQSSRTTASRAAAKGRQEPIESDLTRHQRKLLKLRVAHLLEVATGFCGGDPLRPGPGEPKPCYDPGVTTLTQRRWAKVEELTRLDKDQARVLGLDRVGYRTLIRWEARRRRYGAIGCADDRWLRPALGHLTINEQVREAIYAVHGECLYRSRISMRTRERLIHQYVREQFGQEATGDIPSYETLRTAWHDWFGSGGGRQRYVRSAAKSTSGEHVVIHRPGQVVALDTTVMPVKVRETVFGDPVSVHLTLALDVCTRSLVGFRLTLVSDSSIDIAMLLRDITMPLPMRPGWGDDMEWPYPGLPANVVADFAGHQVAGLPFFSPETVTTDHGSVYRNHHLVEVERVLGCNILPARVLRPTDKQAVERSFGAIRSLLFELLHGYTGVDVADRGEDPEADADLTIEKAEHVIATWIVKVWQNRKLGEHAPSWDPKGDHSPNSLFAASMAQGGFAMQIPSPELYYELLPAHHVQIHHERGVKIGRLWYDGDALDEYRDEPSARGGKHKRRYLIRSDPRDARSVFFQDPKTHDWHSLRWKGLPPGDEIPSFGDARVREMLTAARKSGLKPQTDRELLPVLLDLLGAHAPVESWKSLPKAKRTEITRDDARGRAAAADRPVEQPVRLVEPKPAAAQVSKRPMVAEPRRPQQARDIDNAVDADRRDRRAQALQQQAPLPPPARLGEAFRRGNLFLLTNDEAADSTLAE
ncbi:hypothetical protein K7711_16055 [Nocardia sp. CA2R105]|uniref:hypothetical protein n=1 Tax=Nocardia coffeae TaxID=2873381 RepID=UPI001CA6D23A|nr:hypothetical protein [Nocardia coffeae]MBY8858000.1 hypothetical protein [Nocardia coffeae]